MSFLTDKVLVTLFILRLKTKRVVKSAISGKLNYKARTVVPYIIGACSLLWALFVFSI